MDETNNKKFGISVIYDNMEPPEQLMYIGGYVFKAAGVFTGVMGAVASRNPNVSTDDAVLTLGVGVAFYTIGSVINFTQTKIQTYKKLDNIEKLLIEQNNLLKSIDNTKLKGE